MDYEFLPPPHCGITEFQGRVLIHDVAGNVFVEMSPDGYDANNLPVWNSGASKEEAVRRAAALRDLITFYHNSWKLREPIPEGKPCPSPTSAR
jgi:hypothetical protein